MSDDTIDRDLREQEQSAGYAAVAASSERSAFGANDANRRAFITASALGVAIAASPALAAPVSPRKARPVDDAGFGPEDRMQMDRAAVAELVQRERSARDQGHWDEMAACYHPESMIQTAWFKGTGAEFVAATRRNLGSGKIVSLHQLSPSVVTIHGGRALADTGCQLVAFQDLDGVPITHVGHVRLLWRAQKLGTRWLVMGLNVIYARDYIVPCDPNVVPKIDAAQVAKYRLSYRYEAYMFARSGRPTSDDLPGIDRPETVTAVRASDAAWLATG